MTSNDVVYRMHDLSNWLAHLENLHPQTVELGLGRVLAVQERLGLYPSFPVITVGGTNGKGSTCAMLESILRAARYRTGLYTSPHLLHYNERVRVNGAEVGDAALCEAFAAVEAARGEISLTYFEFGTLAALWTFMREKVEVAILEVGLGGRLDAVNAFDPDCAIVTSVDIDHTDYLGTTREAIGFEKAGIFRAGKPAIYGETNAPESVTQQVAEIGADYRQIGADFGFDRVELAQWCFWARDGRRMVLPHPALRGVRQLANASVALAALGALADRLPVTPDEVRQGLLTVALPGRFQVLPGRPQVILDVAHNPHAAAVLAENLGSMPPVGKTFAVFGMLRDKDIPGVIRAMASVVDVWLVGGLDEPRGMATRELLTVLEQTIPGATVQGCADVAAAYRRACELADDGDRIAAFGSFHTVAGVLRTGLKCAR